MEIAQIIHLGELRTEAVHLLSKKQIVTDAPSDNNGKGAAFSPTDLMSTSLGCCAMTIMGIVAERNNIDLKGTKIKVTKIMESNPRRVSEIVLEFLFRTTYSEKEKALLENAAKTCPVAKSLSSDLKQTMIFTYP